MTMVSRFRASIFGARAHSAVVAGSKRPTLSDGCYITLVNFVGRSPFFVRRTSSNRPG
jgi:hypothetical protein